MSPAVSSPQGPDSESGKMSDLRGCSSRGPRDRPAANPELGSGPATVEPAPDGPGRSLAEVLDLGANVLRSGLLDVGPGGDYDEIQRVFRQAQRAIESAGIPRSEVAPGTIVEGPVSLVRFDDVVRLSDGEFLRTVQELLEANPAPLALERESMEELSVLLALVVEDDQRAHEVAGRLEAFLQSVPSERDRELWFGALVELSSARHRAFFDRAMMRCARGMRYARPSFADRLVQAMREARDLERFETLWPWAANELLLIEREKGQEAANGLVQAVAAMPVQRLSHGYRRLLHLDALARGHLPLDAFQSRRPELFLLWAELLSFEESAAIAVPTVLRGLRLAPPEWGGAVALAGLWEEHPWAASLLRQMLIEWPVDCASPIMSELACRAILHTLEVLERGQRGSAWALESLEWLSQAQFRGAGDLYRAILRERRAVFLPTWPKAARRIARRALRALER